MSSSLLLRAMLVAGLMAGLCGTASAQDEEATRAVRILQEPSAGAPSTETPGQAPPVSTPPAPVFAIEEAELQADNPAGIALQILPGPELQVGTRIAFRIATKKPGYLILIDVDASGQLTQIYPNKGSLLGAGARARSNFVRPGQTILVPDTANPLSGFEFVATPPNGVAMVVAILSDLPVQLIDLPDVPQPFVGRAAALKYLTEMARSLRIPRADDSGLLQEAKWSFNAKFYVIR